MTDQKPTGVFVRLPLSGAEAAIMRDHIMAQILTTDALEHTLHAIGTPVTGGNLDPSRESFEKFYAQMCARATGHNTTPEYVSGLRMGDTYGSRTFLNNIWQAWPEYVQYSQAQIAALEAEVVRLREALEGIENANNNLCFMRSNDTYQSMLRDNCGDLLVKLDDARRVARETLKGSTA